MKALSAPDPGGPLRYVLDAVREIRGALQGRVPLIGFSGSPFTLACYMVEGGGSDDFRHIKGMLYKRPDLLHHILEVNAQAVTAYLNAQVEAGAQALMIFDTWGGSLTDMVRSRRLIEIILEEKLAENVLQQGKRLVERLRALAKAEGGFTNVRGLGSLVAFTLDTPEERNAMLARLFERELMALKSGVRSIRFRLPFVINAAEIDEMVKRVAAALPKKVRV